MSTSMLEREIKLRFASPDEAREAIGRLNATPVRGRRLQEDCLVDTADAAGLTVTLLSWQLSGTGTQPALVGSIEVVLVGRDRAVRTQVIKDSEPVSADLPGNLATASGRLMQRLAASSVALASALR